MNIRVPVKLLAYLVNARFCVSVITWKTNGVRIKNSDHPTCRCVTFIDVESISWVFHEGISSRGVSVSSWFNWFINWICSISCFRKNWFAASLLRWCCNPKRSFSIYICSDEKISENCCCSFTEGVWSLTSQYLRMRRFLDLQRILLCIISWICIWFHRCFILKRFCILFSVVIYIINFVFRWSLWVWYNSSSLWHCFINFPRELELIESRSFE